MYREHRDHAIADVNEHAGDLVNNMKIIVHKRDSIQAYIHKLNQDSQHLVTLKQKLKVYKESIEKFLADAVYNIERTTDTLLADIENRLHEKLMAAFFARQAELVGDYVDVTIKNNPYEIVDFSNSFKLLSKIPVEFAKATPERKQFVKNILLIARMKIEIYRFLSQQEKALHDVMATALQ